MPNDPVTCRQVRLGLTEYLEQALPPARRQGMEAHFRDCEACRTELAETRCLRRLLRELPRPGAPAGAADRLAVQLGAIRR